MLLSKNHLPMCPPSWTPRPPWVGPPKKQLEAGRGIGLPVCPLLQFTIDGRRRPQYYFHFPIMVATPDFTRVQTSEDRPDTIPGLPEQATSLRRVHLLRFSSF